LTLLIATPDLGSAQSISLTALESKARAGDVLAQLELASRFDFGTGVRKSRKSAEYWYRLAAGAGNADAQNSLGSMLQERRKYEEARGWYEKAAAQAHPQGTHNLAYLYDLGLGVPQDRIKGKEQYNLAAKLGWGEAMWNLANMAALGQAGPVDWFATCVWTVRALQSSQGANGTLAVRAQQGMRELKLRLATEELERCRIEAERPL
jgi:TPR repeat protein